MLFARSSSNSVRIPSRAESVEIQGSGIKGGVKHEVGRGDVIEIPAGVPHQFFIAPGTQITYLVVKVVKH
jgi:quercetin dioxygenase-like cupin family protein